MEGYDMDPIQPDPNVAVPTESFDAQFEEALGNAVVTAGIMIGSSLMSQTLTQFAESNAELDA
jgi:hypothetical protein